MCARRKRLWIFANVLLDFRIFSIRAAATTICVHLHEHSVYGRRCIRSIIPTKSIHNSICVTRPLFHLPKAVHTHTTTNNNRTNRTKTVSETKCGRVRCGAVSCLLFFLLRFYFFFVNINLMLFIPSHSRWLNSAWRLSLFFHATFRAEQPPCARSRPKIHAFTFAITMRWVRGWMCDGPSRRMDDGGKSK